jgi:hypothetical protein
MRIEPSFETELSFTTVLTLVISAQLLTALFLRRGEVHAILLPVAVFGLLLVAYKILLSALRRWKLSSKIEREDSIQLAAFLQIPPEVLRDRLQFFLVKCSVILPDKLREHRQITNLGKDLQYLFGKYSEIECSGSGFKISESLLGPASANEGWIRFGCNREGEEYVAVPLQEEVAIVDISGIVLERFPSVFHLIVSELGLIPEALSHTRHPGP